MSRMYTRKTLLPTLHKVLGLKIDMYRIENRWCYAIHPPKSSERRIDADPIWVDTNICGLNPTDDTQTFWYKHITSKLSDEAPDWLEYVHRYQALMWKKHPFSAKIWRIPKPEDDTPKEILDAVNQFRAGVDDAFFEGEKRQDGEINTSSSMYLRGLDHGAWLRFVRLDFGCDL